MSVIQSFSLTPGQVLALRDPTSNSGSAKVQLQNGSGYGLMVTNGQGPQSIAPNNAATYLTQGGAGVMVTVATLGSPGVGLTVEWLLPGESSSMPDGPIPVTYLPPVYNVSSTSTTVGIVPGGTVTLVAAPPAGYANNLGLMSLRQNCDVLGFLAINGVTSGDPIVDQWIPVGPAEHPEYSLLQPYILDWTTTEAIQGSYTASGASGGSDIQVTICYRQILLPA